MQVNKTFEKQRRENVRKRHEKLSHTPRLTWKKKKKKPHIYYSHKSRSFVIRGGAKEYKKILPPLLLWRAYKWIFASFHFFVAESPRESSLVVFNNGPKEGHICDIFGLIIS